MDFRAEVHAEIRPETVGNDSTGYRGESATPGDRRRPVSRLSKAGVPRYAEIICFSDEPGEAAVNYFILKLMGYPDVKVWVV